MSFHHVAIFLISMVPLIELRGAVPYGVGFGVPLFTVLPLAVVGNMIPVPIILLFAKKILLWCCTWKYGGSIFEKIHQKGVKAGEKMQEKTGQGIYWALFLFVAIPLPGTGAWTGCLAATLLDLKFSKSVLAVLAGVCTAGIIMAVVSTGLFAGLSFLV